jgi:hypothetical protein
MAEPNEIPAHREKQLSDERCRYHQQTFVSAKAVDEEGLKSHDDRHQVRCIQTTAIS